MPLSPFSNAPHRPDSNQPVIFMHIVIHRQRENRQDADIHDAGLTHLQRLGTKQNVNRIAASVTA